MLVLLLLFLYEVLFHFYDVLITLFLFLHQNQPFLPPEGVVGVATGEGAGVPNREPPASASPGSGTGVLGSDPLSRTFSLVSACIRVSKSLTSSIVIPNHSSIQAKACRWPTRRISLTALWTNSSILPVSRESSNLTSTSL